MACSAITRSSGTGATSTRSLIMRNGPLRPFRSPGATHWACRPCRATPIPWIRRKGWQKKYRSPSEAAVYEAAPQLGEVGAAVNTSPNANKALLAIGVGEEIAAVANSSPGIYTRNMQTGEFLEFRDRRKTSARYQAPYYTFHRADLLNALASGLEPSLIHLGHRLTGIAERGDGVALSFANGTTVEAESVIGADGVRSVVRHALYGEDNPSYTGQMVWRALLKGSDVPPEILEPTGHIQWVGPGCHLLAYYIRGTALVNIVTQEDTDKWVAEGW